MDSEVSQAVHIPCREKLTKGSEQVRSATAIIRVPKRGCEKLDPHTSTGAELHVGTLTYKLPLPRVVEEISEYSSSSSSSHSSSTNNIEGDRTSSSNVSSTSNSFHRMVSKRKSIQEKCPTKKEKEKEKEKEKKKVGSAIVSMFVWSWRKLRDGYVSCMMSMDGRGDLSSLVHGATFATHTKYFADPPTSKDDMLNYG